MLLYKIDKREQNEKGLSNFLCTSVSKEQTPFSIKCAVAILGNVKSVGKKNNNTIINI